ncbi:MAG: M20/M25/M40 family metallo-hydrolase, partial [Spirochaetota bacterium]
MKNDAFIKRYGDAGRWCSAERMFHNLLALFQIDSPSGSENVICQHLSRYLASLKPGSEHRDGSGNLYARFDGGNPDGITLMFAAHMDTWPTLSGERSAGFREDGIVYETGSLNLGADDKCGIAMILELLHMRHRYLQYLKSLDVLFTVGEETAWKGARLASQILLDGVDLVVSTDVPVRKTDESQTALAVHHFSRKKDRDSIVQVLARSAAEMSLSPAILGKDDGHVGGDASIFFQRGCSVVDFCSTVVNAHTTYEYFHFPSLVHNTDWLFDFTCRIARQWRPGKNVSQENPVAQPPLNVTRPALTCPDGLAKYIIKSLKTYDADTCARLYHEMARIMDDEPGAEITRFIQCFLVASLKPQRPGFAAAFAVVRERVFAMKEVLVEGLLRRNMQEFAGTLLETGSYDTLLRCLCADTGGEYHGWEYVHEALMLVVLDSSGLLNTGEIIILLKQYVGRYDRDRWLYVLLKSNDVSAAMLVDYLGGYNNAVALSRAMELVQWVYSLCSNPLKNLMLKLLGDMRQPSTAHYLLDLLESGKESGETIEKAVAHNADLLMERLVELINIDQERIRGVIPRVRFDLAGIMNKEIQRFTGKDLDEETLRSLVKNVYALTYAHHRMENTSMYKYLAIRKTFFMLKMYTPHQCMRLCGLLAGFDGLHN